MVVFEVLLVLMALECTSGLTPPTPLQGGLPDTPPPNTPTVMPTPKYRPTPFWTIPFGTPAVFKYNGFLELRLAGGQPDMITSDRLAGWLSSRTNESFELGPYEKFLRISHQDAKVWFKLETPSASLLESFKRSENVAWLKGISNYNVIKAFLWLEFSRECPDGSRCDEGQWCSIGDSGVSQCDRGSQPGGSGFNPYGLIAIPCLLLVIIASILVPAYVICYRKRLKSEKPAEESEYIQSDQIIKLPRVRSLGNVYVDRESTNEESNETPYYMYI